VEEERAVKCIKKDLSCPRYYAFEKDVWTSVWTINILDKAFREVRSWPRPTSSFFANEPSVYQLMNSISKMLNKKCKSNTLELFPQISGHDLLNEPTLGDLLQT
jgi:hypothetical protein